MAKQLREVVRGKTDASFRQVEAEFMAHRPAQPRIDARRGWPHGFDEAAQDDAIGFGQPRFELAEDVQLRARLLGPPDHAVGKGGLEYLRIVAASRPAGRSFPAGQAGRRKRMRAPSRPRLGMPWQRRAHRRRGWPTPRGGAGPVRRNPALWRLTRLSSGISALPSAAISASAWSSSKAFSRVRGSARCSEEVSLLSSLRNSSRKSRSRRRGRRFRPAAAFRATARTRAPRCRASTRLGRRQAGAADA